MDSGGCAYPVVLPPVPEHSSSGSVEFYGATIWDLYFMHMAAALVNALPTQPPDAIARDAAGYADAMIAERRMKGI